MGTALSVDHLRSLRNALPPAEGAVVLVLDGDAAGVRATERVCKDVLVVLEGEERMAGIQVTVAQLPRGEGQPKDPADFVMVRAWGPVGWLDEGNKERKETLAVAAPFWSSSND
jgi:DNA primase